MADGLGCIIKQEYEEELPPPEDRVYVKPEDIPKLPKGLRIFRGPRGGLCYSRRQYKELTGKEPEVGVREEGVDRAGFEENNVDKVDEIFTMIERDEWTDKICEKCMQFLDITNKDVEVRNIVRSIVVMLKAISGNAKRYDTEMVVGGIVRLATVINNLRRELEKHGINVSKINFVYDVVRKILKETYGIKGAKKVVELMKKECVDRKEVERLLEESRDEMEEIINARLGDISSVRFSDKLINDFVYNFVAEYKSIDSVIRQKAGSDVKRFVYNVVKYFDDYGVDINVAASLARGMAVFRLWCSGQFYKIAGWVEDMVNTVRNVNRPIRRYNKEDVKEELEGLEISIDDVMLWKKFVDEIVSRYYEGIDEIIVFRGIGYYELVQLLREWFENGFSSTVKVNGTLASYSVSKDVAERFAKENMLEIIAKAKISKDQIWGGWWNASERFSTEELEVICEIPINGIEYELSIPEHFKNVLYRIVSEGRYISSNYQEAKEAEKVFERLAYLVAMYKEKIGRDDVVEFVAKKLRDVVMRSLEADNNLDKERLNKVVERLSTVLGGE